MRCPECGHSLISVPDGAPCTECGVASGAAEREPGLLPSPRSLFMRFGWPSIAGVLMIALTWAVALVPAPSIAGLVPAFVIITAVVFLVVGPINTASQVRILMNRLPRRVRTAPLLALIPRNVLIPLLASLATVPVNVAIGFGACLGAFMVGDPMGR